MKAIKGLLATAASAALLAGLAAPVHAVDWKDVTDDRLLNAESNGDDWLIYGHNYSATRHTPAKDINTGNVAKLKPVYQIALGTIEGQELTPTVNGGILIAAVSQQYVDAYDAATGKRLWRHEVKVPKDATQFTCCGKITRGVGIYGDKIYYGTLESKVVALNAKDGKVAWEKTLQDYKAGYTITMAPTIVKGKVLVGFSGGEFGIIGQIVALDKDTGNEVWKHNTIPGPGEEGYDTWGKDSAKYGGGAAWLTAAYDKGNNQTYWGTGNPAPWNAEMRPGDNLFSNSMIAVDLDSGKRTAYFQQVPNDKWDWDSMNEAVLATATVNGKKTDVVLNAHKNGFLYTMARKDLKFLQAAPFVNHDWGTVDKNGKMQVKEGKSPGVNKKATFCPSYFGGKGWAHMALNPDTGMLVIPTTDMCVTLHHEETSYKKGTMYLGAGGEMVGPGKGELTGFDINKNKVAWKWKNPSPLQSGSALSTAGGLAFVGTMEGDFVAVDSSNGKELWRHKTPSGIVGGPISFKAGGKQMIAVISGYGGAFPLWAGKGIPEHVKNQVNPGGVLNVYALD